MALHFRGIGHVAFQCRNLESQRQFYEDVLGFVHAFDKKDDSGVLREVWLEGPHHQFVELRPFEYQGDNRQSSHSHFHCCLLVTDRKAAVRSLQEKGVVVQGADNDQPGMCGSYCMFVTDPEGNQWELMEFTQNSKQITLARKGEF